MLSESLFRWQLFERILIRVALGNIITTYYNNGRFQTDGIDTQIDWSFNLGPGRFTLNSVFTYLLSLKSAELASDAQRRHRR